MRFSQPASQLARQPAGSRRYRQPETQSVMLQPASQPEPARSSEPVSQPVSQAASQDAAQQPFSQQFSPAPASQPEPARASHPKPASQAASQVVLRGVALLYESPGGNQVDGLPPVPTFPAFELGALRVSRAETRLTGYRLHHIF